GVVERRNAPAGRKPLSASTSHSYPRVCAGSVYVVFGASEAAAVFRQKRILPSVAGTLMERVPGLSGPVPFTINMVPIKAFSGFPPSAGGLKPGSRQVPVQVGGSA